MSETATPAETVKPIPPTRPSPVPARCPECTWRSGPYPTPAAAHEVTIAHLKLKHAGIVGLILGAGLPEPNEIFARKSVAALMQQSARIQRARSKRIVGAGEAGPAQINVEVELVKHIENTNGALMSILDVLLEMRTGRPELIGRRPEGEEQKAQAAAAEQDSDTAPAAPPAEEEAKAS